MIGSIERTFWVGGTGIPIYLNTQDPKSFALGRVDDDQRELIDSYGSDFLIMVEMFALKEIAEYKETLMMQPVMQELWSKIYTHNYCVVGLKDEHSKVAADQAVDSFKKKFNGEPK